MRPQREGISKPPSDRATLRPSCAPFIGSTRFCRRVGRIHEEGAKARAAADDIRSAFLDIWIEPKALPLKAANRPALASALPRLLTRVEIAALTGAHAVPIFQIIPRGE